MRQAAKDACSFVEGMGMDKADFLEDKRAQQAVVMSLIILGEAVTKFMDGYAAFANAHPECRGAACATCATASFTATSTSVKHRD